jgi:hypothetical protein
MKYKILTMNLVAAFLLSLNFSFSQVTAADYKRADDLDSVTAGKVLYGNVKPTWIGSSGQFMYESTTPDGVDYVIVDALNQTKSSAFDQKRFIESFEIATGQKAEPGKLPIKNIVFTDRMRSFSFIYDNYYWICNMRDYRLIKGDRTIDRPRTDWWGWGFRDELAHEPVESPDKKWTAVIKNYNVYIRSHEDGKEYQLSLTAGLENITLPILSGRQIQKD